MGKLTVVSHMVSEKLWNAFGNHFICPACNATKKAEEDVCPVCKKGLSKETVSMILTLKPYYDQFMTEKVEKEDNEPGKVSVFPHPIIAMGFMHDTAKPTPDNPDIMRDGYKLEGGYLNQFLKAGEADLGTEFLGIFDLKKKVEDGKDKNYYIRGVKLPVQGMIAAQKLAVSAPDLSSRQLLPQLPRIKGNWQHRPAGKQSTRTISFVLGFIAYKPVPKVAKAA